MVANNKKLKSQTKEKSQKSKSSSKKEKDVPTEERKLSACSQVSQFFLTTGLLHSGR